MCTLQNAHFKVTTIAFNGDCSKMVTVGNTKENRIQIIVWDLNIIFLEQSRMRDGILISKSSPALGDPLNTLVNESGRCIARQLSDFPIASMSFSQFEDGTLVSCGRENVRFWRLRKKHLPGRPVFLGEYTRGYIFNNIAFINESGQSASDSRQQCVLVSSNHGIILKIDYRKEQLICAYQLHNSSICAFTVSHGYAVTGASDNKLRVWPLDFSDYLMEANHEGAVSSIKVSSDGLQLVVGTTTGTIGVLKIAEHYYSTVQRSHVGPIFEIVGRPSGEDFATIGGDKTIRVWDLCSTQQKFEFSSIDDEPRTIAYHPISNIVACGFSSGYLRIFDIPTTSTICERKHHKADIACLEYVCKRGSLIGDSTFLSTEDKSIEILLVSICFDGIMIVYDAMNNYEPKKSISLERPHSKLLYRSSFNPQSNLLAVSTGSLSSLVVFDCHSFTHLVKSGQIIYNNAVNPTDSSSKQYINALESHDMTAPVTGLAFRRDIEPFSYLIVSLDKSIIQIPILHSRTDDTHPAYATSVLSKKLQFGSISNMFYDSSSELCLFVVSANSDPVISNKSAYQSKFQDATESDLKNKESLFLCSVYAKSMDCSMKLCVSSVQIYDEHPGKVLHAVFAISNAKIITVDNTGAMIFWKIREDKVNRLRDQKSSPISDETQINMGVGTKIVHIKEPTDEPSEDSIVESHKLEASDDRNLKMMKMVNEFERAVELDPSMWSATSVKTSKNEGSFLPLLQEGSNYEESFVGEEYAAKSNDMENKVRLEDMFDDDDIHPHSMIEIPVNHDDVAFSPMDSPQSLSVNTTELVDTMEGRLTMNLSLSAQVISPNQNLDSVNYEYFTLTENIIKESEMQGFVSPLFQKMQFTPEDDQVEPNIRKSTFFSTENTG